MRGSGYRLNCVEEGRFHLCVMSQLAFEHYAQEGKDIQLIAAFGPQSYVEQHRVFVRPDFKGESMLPRYHLDLNMGMPYSSQ